MQPALHLSGLETMVTRGDRSRKREVLAALTTQFIDLAPRLSDRHIELYDHVFQLLVRGIESDARRTLSEKLSEQARAPLETVRRLARDSMAEVADPVLRLSPVLTEQDLIEVARTATTAHRASVAQRQDIGPAVTDVLVEAREQAVLTALAENPHAGLSEQGAGELAAAARLHAEVAQALAKRMGLDVDAVVRVVDVAKALVVTRLAREQPEARAGEIAQAVDAAAQAVVQREAEEETLSSPPEIIAMLKRKANRSAARALSLLTGLPQSMILEAIVSTSEKPMLLVLKAAGFEKPEIEAVFAPRLGLPVGSRAIREVLDLSDRMVVRDAVAMLAFFLKQDRAEA